MDYGKPIPTNRQNPAHCLGLHRLPNLCYIDNILLEGSHSGLVRAPAKRLGGEIPLVGSNPTPSAIFQPCERTCRTTTYGQSAAR